MQYKQNFHTSVIEKNITQAAYKVKFRKPYRNVDYKFFVHYHPYSDELIEKLNTDGLPALLDVNYLGSLSENLTDFYNVQSGTVQPFPKEVIDVSDEGPYSVYNWELFFHAPLTIAVHLSKNQ